MPGDYGFLIKDLIVKWILEFRDGRGFYCLVTERHPRAETLHQWVNRMDSSDRFEGGPHIIRQIVNGEMNRLGC